MFTYKFRAECSEDVERFFKNGIFVKESESEDEHYEVEVVFKTKLQLEGIIAYMDLMMDMHVPCETVDFFQKYTGERIHLEEREWYKEDVYEKIKDLVYEAYQKYFGIKR